VQVSKIKYLSPQVVVVMIHGERRGAEKEMKNYSKAESRRRKNSLPRRSRILWISTRLLLSFYGNHGKLQIIVLS